jgi:hypothetical protein
MFTAFTFTKGNGIDSQRIVRYNVVIERLIKIREYAIFQSNLYQQEFLLLFLILIFCLNIVNV